MKASFGGNGKRSNNILEKRLWCNAKVLEIYFEGNIPLMKNVGGRLAQWEGRPTRFL